LKKASEEIRTKVGLRITISMYVRYTGPSMRNILKNDGTRKEARDESRKLREIYSK
jgi:hypothetical protein